MRARGVAITAALSGVVLGSAACGDPSGPQQTVHNRPITKSERWSRADSPHIVKGKLTVSRGVTLTIEAGASVLFDSQATLIVGYSTAPAVLQALGTAAAPITMGSLRGATAPGDWIGIRFRGNTTSVLRYVEMQGCGNIPLIDSMPAACLALGNPYQPAESASVLIDHVTVTDGNGGAVVLSSQSSFAPGSVGLTVRNMNGFAAQFRAREAARFPAGGAFSGNTLNEVQLTTDTLTDSLTLGNGVPWAIVGPVLVEGAKEPVLTIAAGDTVTLAGQLTAGQNAAGGLRIGADGGPTVTVHGRSINGVIFGAFAVRSTISDASFETCGSTGGACVTLAGSYSGGPAPAPTIRNVSIGRGSTGGIAMVNKARFGPGSANLTITGVNGVPVFVHQSPISSIPSGHYSGNTTDAIWINQLTVRQNETWPRLDVPYYIYNWVSVGDSGGHPTLSLDSGVTVVAVPGATIRVGEVGPGAIHAVGTATAPITFTSASGNPGGWGGIELLSQTDTSTVFDHVILDNAGALANVQGGFIFYIDVGPVIRHSTISNSAGCGIVNSGMSTGATDFADPALGNTFINNAFGAICGP